jgi:hypothetical protein
MLNMTRSIGTSLGVALTGAVLAMVLNAQAGQHLASTLEANPAQLQVAVRETLLFLACLAGASAVLSAARGVPAAQPLPRQHAATAESVGV